MSVNDEVINSGGLEDKDLDLEEKDPDEDEKKFDLEGILFNEERDYLIDKQGKQVKAHNLKGKFVCLYFLPIYLFEMEAWLLRDTYNLIEMYNQLSESEKDRFEVVFVPVHDGSDSKKVREQYKYFLSHMPWLAIPYPDFEDARRVCHECRVSLYYDVRLFILDPERKVVRCAGGDFLKCYGAEAFPFTPERMSELSSQDQESNNDKTSLVTLLSYPGRDYLISNDQKKFSKENNFKKVLISNLKSKTVALFFYKDVEHCKKLAEELRKVYERHKEDFEVVLVYLHFTGFTPDKLKELSFQMVFKSMPWLALPFKDPMCRKFWRIFESPYEPGDLYRDDKPRTVASLIIFGPEGCYFERHGADILMRYGIDAYPFTRDRAAELEVEKLKKLRLDSLLESTGHLMRGSHVSQHINVSELSQKRVLLFAKDLPFDSNVFLSTLRRQYYRCKGTEDEFEVVYMSLFRNERFFIDCITDLPWLVHPFSNLNLREELASRFFKSFYSCHNGELPLVAFGNDGQILAKEIIRNYDEKRDTAEENYSGGKGELVLWLFP